LHLILVDEWSPVINDVGDDVAHLDGVVLWLFVSWLVACPHHSDGNVGNVGLVAVFLSPTGIEELGV
jgi:hypothetical protein